MKVFSEVISFRGTHGQFGYQQGVKLRESPIMQNRDKLHAKRYKTHFSIDIEKGLQLLDHFAPKLRFEIEGLANALKMSQQEAVRSFAGYYLEVGKSGCSIMTGDQYFVRNYDSHPNGYEGRYVLYQPTDGGYASMGPSMQITGRIDGINEKGLVMGYNFTNRIGSGDGFICNMIGRMLLEYCATVEEGVKLLKAIPHRTSFSYVLMDRSGQSVIVEASPRTVLTRMANVCTNHFEYLTQENRYRNDESIRRMDRINRHLPSRLKANQAYQIFNHRSHAVFSNKYQAWSGTLHTSLYQPSQGKGWIGLGANQRPVVFDLNRFLAGEVLRVRRITGMLESHVPFINDPKWSSLHS
ncbi:C45 family autoproteolytic acyltransferase/hydolase [Amphibacillus cookii]|uniref:C45 family autoproteolytic acyltransferase/hydolase n=1 Tax=Amphibacillus cookii TaxID=767787 RepID=UPI00195BE3D9|nr:putative choloylglycine hydrolase [Amphibacillus cookii]